MSKHFIFHPLAIGIGICLEILDLWVGQFHIFTYIYLTWVIIRFLFNKEKVLVGPFPATVKVYGPLFPAVLLCQDVTDVVVGCWVL